MSAVFKHINDLTRTDIQRYPVWEFANRSELDDDVVTPCPDSFVSNTGGKLFAVQVRFANGGEGWALLGNVSGRNRKATKHFLSLSMINNKNRWFTLARYHDVAADKHGPEALAEFLGMDLSDVFPIHYDISSLASGDRWALTGAISREPEERLSPGELVALALQ